MKISTALRYFFLAVFNAAAFYVIPLAISFESWFLLLIIGLITILINFTYLTERFKALNRADFERRIDNSGAFWKRPSPFNSPMTIDMRRNRWESNRVFGEKGSKL